jgi:hypothetical protein
MEIITLAVELFGVSSLAVASAKISLDKRKTSRAEDHMKNPLRRF